jgi:hypothetical protein
MWTIQFDCALTCTHKQWVCLWPPASCQMALLSRVPTNSLQVTQRRCCITFLLPLSLTHMHVRTHSAYGKVLSLWKLWDFDGFTYFQHPLTQKTGFWSPTCLHCWMYTLLMSDWMDFMHIHYLRVCPLLSLCLVNMKILATKNRSLSNGPPKTKWLFSWKCQFQ